jgi:hypothetical protein
VNVLKSAIVAVRNFYDQQGPECQSTIGMNERSVNGLTIYPNPAENNLFFSFGTKKPLAFYATDVLGREVISKQKVVSTLDISSLPAGIYFFVFDWETHLTTERISVHH